MSDASTMENPTVPWWSTMLQGFFGVIIGMLLLGIGGITVAQGTFIVVQILGWYWFFVGIMNIVFIFVDHTGWGWRLFMGIIGLLAGLSIIQYPLWATFMVPYVLVIVLGIEGIIMGIVEIVRAFQEGSWGLGFLGVMSVLVGGWLIAERYMATLAYPWVAGVFALVLGIAAIVMSFQARKLQKA